MPIFRTSEFVRPTMEHQKEPYLGCGLCATSHDLADFVAESYLGPPDKQHLHANPRTWSA